MTVDAGDAECSQEVAILIAVVAVMMCPSPSEQGASVNDPAWRCIYA